MWNNFVSERIRPVTERKFAEGLATLSGGPPFKAMDLERLGDAVAAQLLGDGVFRAAAAEHFELVRDRDETRP